MKVKALYTVALMVLALLMVSAPVQASKTDDRIEASAKDSYVFKTYLKGDDVKVKVKAKDGVVTLKGTVAEESHKALAEETVANLPDVKSVDNKLEVKGDRPAEQSDAWLSTKVKTTLLFHRNVSAMTQVDTKDGVVTLRGEADSQAQKDLTTEYAMDVEGVKDVNNHMTIAKTAAPARTVGDQIDDASTTALVKMALLYHRSTSGLKTSVTTKDGVVTLTGKGKNAAEVALATKLASDVNGVRSVTNKMTVE
jgi:hyperosmotically inducible periplasmic protein